MRCVMVSHSTSSYVKPTCVPKDKVSQEIGQVHDVN